MDDLFHATVNGRGRILNAEKPEELVTILTELTDNVLEGLGSASSISITDYASGGSEESTLMFQAGYKTGDWRGDVKSYRIDPTTGEILDDGPVWSAADCLDRKPWHQRNIISYDGKFGVEFSDNQLTDAQKTLLGPEFKELVEYIKGKHIVDYRTRSSKLGDIVHASPVLEEGFLYVGANDGMLHTFEIMIDNDGKLKGDETFAYIPSFVFENLKTLADPAYRHKFYVDLTPVVGKGRGLLGGEEVKTMLVGGLGKGGKGYFALDISAPHSMTAENVLWEFPNTANQNELNDMGFSFSKPLVVRTNSTREDESWAVIFGNGYDSVNGNAVLYVLNPKSGDIMKKFVADNPSVDKGNGLSSPIAVDVNSDDKVDFVYVGDLNGNLWKFDLTSNDIIDWKVAYGDGIYSQPLFKAEGPDGDQQPITAKPEVMMHPEGQGLMVFFGTGRYLGQNDFTNKNTQSIYGVWDYGDRAYYPGEWGEYSEDDDQEYLGTFTRDQLSNQPRNVTLLNQTSNNYSVLVNDDGDAPVKVELRVMSGRQPIWKTKDEMNITGSPRLPDLSDIGTSHAGWYYDLPLAGERIISDLVLRDGRLAVVSLRPDPDPCSADASSFYMELNAFTGGSIPEILFDINQDGVIDVADSIVAGYDKNGKPVRIPPAGIQIAGNIQPPANLRLNQLVEINYMSSSTGTVHLLKSPAVQQGVIYWKELER
jgi:Tfp pilus tip-associated adhesin PilY1